MRSALLLLLVLALAAAACERDNRPAVRLEFEIDLTGVPEADADEVARQTAAVVRRRLKERGHRKSRVWHHGTTLVVEVRANPDDVTRIDGLLSRSGTLSLAPVDDDLPFMRDAARRAQDAGGDVKGEREQWYAEDGPSTEAWYLVATDRSVLERHVAGLTPDADHYLAVERIDPHPDAEGRETRWRTRLLSQRDAMVSPQLVDVDVQINSQYGRPEVLIEFGAKDAALFGQLTNRLIGRPIAIVLDGVVSSSPIVRSKIPGGKAVITMGSGDLAREQQEAEDLANVLRTGALPAKLRRTN